MPFDLKFYSNGSYTVDAWLQSLEEEYGGIDSVRILLSHWLQSSLTVFSSYISSCLLHNWHRLVPGARRGTAVCRHISRTDLASST